MTSNVIPFRAATGATARDLEDARQELRAEDGWAVEAVPEGDAPWLSASGPTGVSWAIGRQDGAWFAAPDDGARPGWAGLRTAGDAARLVAGTVRGT
jgi:hypothetical protein